MTTIGTHGLRAGAGVLLAFTLAGHPAAQTTKNISGTTSLFRITQAP